MNIAIIGTGNVGGALARSARRAGHAVTVSSADRAQAEELAGTTGATVAGSNREAVEGAAVTILAVPAEAYDDLATELADALVGKTVIDVANRPTPDPARADCTSHAEELQANCPGAHVVKAFNTVFASRQAEPQIEGRRADGYVASDIEEAKQTVLELVESIGLRPIDVGPLAVARTLEGMGWLHIWLAMQNEWSWQSAWKLVGTDAG